MVLILAAVEIVLCIPKTISVMAIQVYLYNVFNNAWNITNNNNLMCYIGDLLLIAMNVTNKSTEQDYCVGYFTHIPLMRSHILYG